MIKTPVGWADDLALLKDAAAEAGDLALRYFGRTQQTWRKGNDSIIGEVDLAVDRLLADRLRAARPGYGWLSEESVDSPERITRDRVFIVDPIDGTRAFLSGRDQWAVALAVAEAERPVVAVLAVPALRQIFHAVRGGGAYRDGEKLAAGAKFQPGTIRFAGPRRYAAAVAGAVSEPLHEMQYIPSLAYRLALVASGEIDVVVAKPGARDWDLAAADLLVHETGARMADLDGRALRYNRAVTRHPAIMAAVSRLFDAVAQHVKNVEFPAG